MTGKEISIGLAQPADREQILSFTKDTFSWGDYIAEVWNKWLTDDKGRLLIAKMDRRPVGCLHLAFLGNREAWVEGMRVHPDYRRMGVATAMDRSAQEIARRAGCRVLRLETASSNHPAQSTIKTYGYRRALTMQIWTAKTTAGDLVHSRLARPRDARVLLELWERSWMRTAMRGLVHQADGWRWAEMNGPRLVEFIRRELVYVTPAAGAPQGFALIHREEGELGADLVVGRARQFGDLLTDLRHVAHSSGLEFYLTLPVSDRSAKRGHEAGLAPTDHSMQIFECRLS